MANRTPSTAARGGLFRGPGGRSCATTFALISSLFFLSGACNSMLDTLNRHFQNSFALNKMESALVQNAFYLGYFLMALPAGLMARRLGYKRGLMIGLAIIAAGALWFVPATRIGTYWAFLTGLFIIAVGFTCFETIANPYAAALGPLESAAARINLAQSCNGVGWLIGPATAGYFVLSSTSEVNRSNATLYIPYAILGGMAAVMLVVIGLSRLPEIEAEGEEAPDASGGSGRSLWGRPHFVLAVAAQFCYVAAQTGVFSYFINFMASEMPPLPPWLVRLLPTYLAAAHDGAFRITDRGAASLLSFGGFGLFLLGRITGSFALRHCRAHRMLAAYSWINVALMTCVVLRLGWISVAGLCASFFFMSISYPTIFALGIHDLGPQTKQASSYLVMAILGGALLPMLMGWLADRGGMRMGFLIPLVLFALIASYGTAWNRLVTGPRPSRTPGG